MSRFFDLLVATEVYADIDFIMSPTTDGKTETFYLSGTLTSLTVDWGDGTQTTAQATNTHTYTSAGDYRVRVLGDCRAVTSFGISNVYTDVKQDITEVNRMRLPNAVNWTYAFIGCDRLKHMPRGFKAYNATNVIGMFASCTSLEYLPDGFTLEYATNLRLTFYNCRSLVTLPDGFTAPNVVQGPQCFQACYALTSLPSSFDFSNWTDFSTLFRYCSSLVWTPQASVFWERTSPQVRYNGQTFQNCTSLTNYASIPTAWKDGGTTTLYQPPNE